METLKNYRVLLVAILMVGTWFCGFVFGFGFGGTYMHDTGGVNKVSPMILWCILGIAATFFWSLVIVSKKIYPELNKIKEELN